jgi:hypothetical protein
MAATRRATVLFPDPAGPSIAIVSLIVMDLVEHRCHLTAGR